MEEAMQISTKILAARRRRGVGSHHGRLRWWCGWAGGTSGGDTISIGVKEDQPGVGLREGNTRSGFDVETAKYVAKELGFAEDKIKFVASPSAQRENLISSGQVS
jgi:ABC-type amino acid transport substrate-binding protein